MTTRYLDLVGGNDSNDGSTFTLRKKTLNSATTGLTGGDTVRVMASPDATSMAQNATFTNGSPTVTLTTAVTANIDTCDTVWTASANVTASKGSVSGFYREGSESAFLAIASGFTTGLVAYDKMLSSPGSDSIINRASNMLGAGTLTMIQNASVDDASILVTLPFTVYFHGIGYTAVYVGSNSLLMFGAGSGTTTINAASPAIPAIHINGHDASYQRVYAGSEDSNVTYRIRYEGAVGTSGTPGSSTVFWEVTFTAATPGVIKIDMGSNAASALGNSGCTDGAAYFATFASGTVNTGYTLTNTLPVYGTVDFSAYKQISLLVYSGQAIAASVLQLKLCSDNAGATAVNTINLPAIPAGYWTPVVVDTGTALGSSIQSVALYAASDPGTINMVLDNILACKDSTAADSLTHLSYIGKGTDENTEPWMPVESINGTSIRLWGNIASQHARSDSLVTPNYQGATATQTIYKREPIVLAAEQTMAAAGSSLDSKLTVEGGYNRTDMTTKTGRTYLRAGNPSANALTCNFLHDLSFVSLGLHSGGAYGCIFFQGGGHTTSDVCINGGAYGLVCNQGSAHKQALRYSVLCSTTFYLSGGWTINGGYSSFKADYIWGVGNSITSACYGVYDATSNVVLNATLECASIKHVSRAILGSSGVTRWTVRNTVVSDTYVDFQVGTDLYLYNTTCSVEATYGGSNAGYGAIWATKYMGDVTKAAVACYQQGLIIVTATDQRHTASDVSWKFTTSTAQYAWNPSGVSVAKVACVANEQRTVTLWFRRDNTAILMRLAVRGGFVAGIPSNIVTNMAAAANTWEQLTLQFTPTENCVVEVFAECYGDSSGHNAWVDDLGVS